MEMWLLDHVIIPGEPSDPETWRQVTVQRERRWIRADGTEIAAAVCCIDRGFSPDDVLVFAKRNRSRRVLAVRGVEGKPGDPIWSKTAAISSRLRSKNAPYYSVPVVAAKEVLASILRATLAVIPGTNGPKILHIPRSIVAKLPDFLDQITSEKRVSVKGHVAWQKKTEHRRNEAWDCMVYALAGLKSLMLAGFSLTSPTATDAPQPAAEAAPEPYQPAPHPAVFTPAPHRPDNQAGGRSSYRFDRTRSQRRR